LRRRLADRREQALTRTHTRNRAEHRLNTDPWEGCSFAIPARLLDLLREVFAESRTERPAGNSSSTGREYCSEHRSCHATTDTKRSRNRRFEPAAILLLFPAKPLGKRRVIDGRGWSLSDGLPAELTGQRG
jgi:hypothetical protein